MAAGLEDVAIVLEERLPFATLRARTIMLGSDVAVALSGGVAHVGCTVLAQSRPSLSDPKQTSATSSVLNVTGHKDEILCRDMAERLAIALRTTVLCTGGVHVDDATPDQIRQLREANARLADRLAARLTICLADRAAARPGGRFD